MGLKNIFVNHRGLEVLFRLKLEVLQGMVTDGHFHKDITDIKSLVSDLTEIIKEYETQTVGEKL
jgi:hypothetical protein